MASIILWSDDVECTACGETITDSEPRRIFNLGNDKHGFNMFAITHDRDDCDNAIAAPLVAQG